MVLFFCLYFVLCWSSLRAAKCNKCVCEINSNKSIRHNETEFLQIRHKSGNPVKTWPEPPDFGRICENSRIWAWAELRCSPNENGRGSDWPPTHALLSSQSRTRRSHLDVLITSAAAPSVTQATERVWHSPTDNWTQVCAAVSRCRRPRSTGVANRLSRPLKEVFWASNYPSYGVAHKKWNIHALCRLINLTVSHACSTFYVPSSILLRPIVFYCYALPSSRPLV